MGSAGTRGLQEIAAGRNGSYGVSGIALSCRSLGRKVSQGLVPALQKNEIIWGAGV